MIAVSNGFTTDSIVGTAFGFILFPIIVYIIAMICIKIFSTDARHDIHDIDGNEVFENSYLLSESVAK